MIHTIIYNDNMQLQIGLDMVKIWKYDLIVELFKIKYPKYLKYYQNLILNKSRENFAKYFIIKEYGGLFVNFYILNSGTPLTIITMHKVLLSNNNMIFWVENDLSKKDILIDIYGYFEEIICDDIFYVKNPKNSFIKYLTNSVNLNVVPINEYQNKNMLGNIFLSNNLYIFYNKFLRSYPKPILKKDNWYNNFFDKKNKFKDIEILKSIKIKKNLFFSSNYKKIVYPDLIEFKDTDNILIPWNNTYKIFKSIEHFCILILVGTTNISKLFMIILIITCIEYIANYYIHLSLDITLQKPLIDSKIFYKVNKFKFFKELCNEWKTIREEALFVLKNAPRLDIARNYNDWVDNDDFITNVVGDYGWINGWKREEGTIKESNINTEWFNYGLIHRNTDFNENIKYCPKTYSILTKIKKHINISGFSMMVGNCILEPHTDMTGKINGSLAFHLGLIVPKPNETCKLVVTDEYGNNFGYTEKEGGSMIFDATFKHYAYNQSNQERIILYIDFKI